MPSVGARLEFLDIHLSMLGIINTAKIASSLKGIV